MPFKQHFFNPFLEDINKSNNLPPISIEKILASPLGKNLQQDLFFKNNEWISIIRLAGVNNEQALFDWLKNNPDAQPYYLNLREATSSLMSDYQQTALYRLLLGSFIYYFYIIFCSSLSSGRYYFIAYRPRRFIKRQYSGSFRHTSHLIPYSGVIIGYRYWPRLQLIF